MVRVMSSILNGERVYLRPLQESDSESFCVWYNDEQVTRYLGMKPLSGEKAKAAFNQMLSDPDGVYFGIIKKDEKRIIGYVFLADISTSHKVAQEFGIVIGDKDLWGHGFGGEAAKLILKYGFRRLKLHRIQLKVLDFNKRANRMYNRLGFVEEGVQREARLVDGKWRNVVLMGMLEKEFEKCLDCV